MPLVRATLLSTTRLFLSPSLLFLVLLRYSHSPFLSVPFVLAASPPFLFAVFLIRIRTPYPTPIPPPFSTPFLLLPLPLRLLYSPIVSSSFLTLFSIGAPVVCSPPLRPVHQRFPVFFHRFIFALRARRRSLQFFPGSFHFTVRPPTPPRISRPVPLPRLSSLCLFMLVLVIHPPRFPLPALGHLSSNRSVHPFLSRCLRCNGAGRDVTPAALAHSVSAAAARCCNSPWQAPKPNNPLLAKAARITGFASSSLQRVRCLGPFNPLRHLGSDNALLQAYYLVVQAGFHLVTGRLLPGYEVLFLLGTFANDIYRYIIGTTRISSSRFLSRYVVLKWIYIVLCVFYYFGIMPRVQG